MKTIAEQAALANKKDAEFQHIHAVLLNGYQQVKAKEIHVNQIRKSQYDLMKEIKELHRQMSTDQITVETEQLLSFEKKLK